MCEINSEIIIVPKTIAIPLKHQYVSTVKDNLLSRINEISVLELSVFLHSLVLMQVC